MSIIPFPYVVEHSSCEIIWYNWINKFFLWKKKHIERYLNQTELCKNVNIFANQFIWKILWELLSASLLLFLFSFYDKATPSV